MTNPRRRTAWPALAVATATTAATLSGFALAAPTASAASLSVRVADTVIGTDRTLSAAVTCGTAKRCTGKVALKVPGAGTVRKAYSVKGKKTASVNLSLSAKQAAKLRPSVPTKATISANPKGAGKTVKRSINLRAAAPALKVRTTKIEVGHAAVAGIDLACTSSALCAGTVVIAVAGKAGGGTQTVSIKPGKTQKVNFVLNAAQVAALGDKKAWIGSTVKVTETAPKRVSATTKVTVQMDHGDTGGGDHGGHDDHGSSNPAYSNAYNNQWKPTEYDTCTSADHNTYAVTGVDGKLYPAWHPAVHTRSDGSTCTFGHEHGDNPENSDLYEWVMAQYKSENPKANGLPFGYGSEQLTNYGNANGINVHRHEDDPGHKVVVANNQAMGVQFQDKFGDERELVCDTLIKAHQGSHSSDATKNNTHELIYATACNDGSKLLTTLMSNYGNANELHASCTRPFFAEHGPARVVETKGSILPKGEGGSRLIPTADCVETYLRNGSQDGALGGTIDDRRGSPNSTTNGWWWAGYEQWQSFNSIRTADGVEVARFEPWFGLQNPSRYYLSNTSDNTVVGYLNDLAWENGNQVNWGPWKQQKAASATKIDRKSPQAWFNGAIRDAWLTTTKVDNLDAETNVIYTDPWGKAGTDKPFTGSVRTYISRTTNVDYVTNTTPTVINRSVRTKEALTRSGASAPATMQFFYDYGRDAEGNSLGVHAPN